MGWQAVACICHWMLIQGSNPGSSQWGLEYVTALLRLLFPIFRLKGLLTIWSAWFKQELACPPLPPALPPWPGPLGTEASLQS